MDRKLTLRLDEKLIEHAKQHAEKAGTSVSQMFANFVAALDSIEDKNQSQAAHQFSEYSPLTRSLIGLLRTGEADQDLEKHYRDHLEEKYR